MQIGKRGLTHEFVESVRNSFKHHIMVRISALKNASRNKEEIKVMADKIVQELGDHYDYRITGFTILVKKHKKKLR